MSIEQNLTDFEEALYVLEEETKKLKMALDIPILEMIDKVISEYEEHLSNDIEVLMTEYSDVEEELNVAERQIEAMLEEIETLENDNTILEDALAGK